MKVFIFKYSVPLVYVLACTVLVLLFAATFFYQQKTRVQDYNRVLILQNDSILSENIHLKNSLLQQDDVLSGKKEGLSIHYR